MDLIFIQKNYISATKLLHKFKPIILDPTLSPHKIIKDHQEAYVPYGFISSQKLHVFTQQMNIPC